MPKYIAGLCTVTKAGLAAQYESVELYADDDQGAAGKARAWLNSSDREFGEQTWLQVLTDSRAIHSEKVKE